MTNKEAITVLNSIYGVVSPTVQKAIDVATKAIITVEQAHNSLLNEEESERLLDFIGDDTGLHERAMSDLNDTVADVLRKCKRGDV
jgi:hypothetical protein